eukprot:TRINITY_DN9639_c0_g1_i8.p1 TRINITY_DN9639_c0_g1~~TRINITY_DN9639_c0_g1_i8.p1  ORF type:complete len:853 (+),score=284.89 TRINITY_DN9639_c0_g1_i8:79-2637(+)
MCIRDRERDTTIAQLEKRLANLQTDFDYNLEIIGERDRDIDELTNNILELRRIIDNKDGEIREIGRTMEENQRAFEVSRDALNTKMKGLAEKLDELRVENRLYKTGQLDEVKRTRAEFEDQIRQLQRESQQKEKESVRKEVELKRTLQNLQQETKLEKDNYENLIQRLQREAKETSDELSGQLARVITENESLRNELTEKKRHLIERDASANASGSEQMRVIQRLTAENDAQKKELERAKLLWSDQERALRGQVEQLSREASKVNDVLAAKKAKYKGTIKDLKSSLEKLQAESQKELNEVKQNYANEVRELNLELDALRKSEVDLRQKVKETEFQAGRELKQAQERFQAAMRSMEADLKRIRNEQELKDLQIRHLSDEKSSAQKESENMKTRLKELEDKVLELERENRILIQEVVEFKKGNPNVVLFKNLTAEEEKKNEKASARKPKPKEIEPLMELDDSVDRMFSEDLGPASPLPSMRDSKAQDKFKFGGKRPNPVNTGSQIRLSALEQKGARVSSLEAEIEEYKKIVNEMRNDMEYARRRIDLMEREKEALTKELKLLNDKNTSLMEEMLKLNKRIADLTKEASDAQMRLNQVEAMKTMMDNNRDIQTQENLQLRKDLATADAELTSTRSSLNDLRREHSKLKQERDKLIEISNELRSQVGKAEDLKDTIDELEGRVYALQQENNRLMDEITNLNREVEAKSNTIERMKTMIPIKELQDARPPSRATNQFGKPSKKVSPPNRIFQDIPQYDRYAEAGGGRVQEQPKKNELYILSQKQQLQSRPVKEDDQEGDRRPERRPASRDGPKAPTVRREVPRREDEKRQSPKKPLVRNYNQRNDEDYKRQDDDGFL